MENEVVEKAIIRIREYDKLAAAGFEISATTGEFWRGAYVKTKYLHETLYHPEIIRLESRNEDLEKMWRAALQVAEDHRDENESLKLKLKKADELKDAYKWIEEWLLVSAQQTSWEFTPMWRNLKKAISKYENDPYRPT